ncbi:hypothetical protein [Mongoliitalea lutea]|uniref:Lipoprotein n=1 Tax=Mongoliitalea lutea TaxID=849756 RepID=A0A8J3G5C6_9BACT|nr:hypothetical protein [Mongoliitalea lutea]GHB37868.1 hypothetical protein GCM10008106_18870 [Mongoliitalea lutea]
MKYFPVLVLLLIFSSCVQSKIFPIGPSRACFEPTDGVVLAPFQDIGFNEAVKLEGIIQEELKKAGFGNVETAPDLEYEMLAAGIKDVDDPDQFYRFFSELKRQWFIQVDIVGWKNEGGLAYEQEDLGRKGSDPYYVSPQISNSNVVKVRFIVWDTQQDVKVYEFESQTTASGIPIPSGNDEDMYSLNLSSMSMVLQKSVRKGAIHLGKKMKCI